VIKYDIRRFARDFQDQKMVGRMGWTDFKPINDITITINGGRALTENIAAHRTGSRTDQWLDYTGYLQHAGSDGKNFFFQHFVNASGCRPYISHSTAYTIQQAAVHIQLALIQWQVN
jgi:hypothetical protein